MLVRLIDVWGRHPYRKSLLGIGLTLLLVAIAPSVSSQAPDRPVVVRIEDVTRDEIAQIAQHVDVWHVDTEAQAVVAAVHEVERPWLAAQGFRVTEVPALNATPLTIPNYPCYRTVEELDAQIAQWEVDYPHLVERITIGESFEGRPLTVLRLGPRTGGSDLPTLFLMGGIHGRELISNEVAASFVALLLSRDGLDADVTWLLDHHNIDVLITANPDGHVKNEPGQPWAYWRKNTNATYGCSWGDYGVDLNRNSSFQWLPPDTGDPYRFCRETYPGPTAKSEHETDAIETYMRQIFPDQRDPDLWAPAPDDATGVFVTLHSYGNLVLWPWGHTYSPAPNGAQLERLGRNLATFNGHTPQQAINLYKTAGTTDDWAYGELGIAAYTFEIGSSAEGFYPSCDRYDALVEPNLEALLYAARVARAPYQLPFGPDVLTIHGPPPSAAPLHAGLPFSATLGVRGSMGTTITAAEAYLDIPPWEGGTSTFLQPVDGLYNASSETVTGTISPTLSAGRHLLYVRGLGANGQWGPVSAAFVDVRAPFGITPKATSLDGRPGSVLTVPLTLTNRSETTYTVALTNSVASWPNALTPVTTSLPSKSSAPLTMTVSIPDDALHGPFLTEMITITASAMMTPTLRHAAVIDVHARPFLLWLPSILKHLTP